MASIWLLVLTSESYFGTAAKLNMASAIEPVLLTTSTYGEGVLLMFITRLFPFSSFYKCCATFLVESFSGHQEFSIGIIGKLTGL